MVMVHIQDFWQHYISLHEDQWILTNATILKDSGFGFIMVVYEKLFLEYFKVFERNEEICIKANIA